MFIIPFLKMSKKDLENTFKTHTILLLFPHDKDGHLNRRWAPQYHPCLHFQSPLQIPSNPFKNVSYKEKLSLQNSNTTFPSDSDTPRPIWCSELYRPKRWRISSEGDASAFASPTPSLDESKSSSCSLQNPKSGACPLFEIWRIEVRKVISFQWRRHFLTDNNSKLTPNHRVSRAHAGRDIFHTPWISSKSLWRRYWRWPWRSLTATAQKGTSEQGLTLLDIPKSSTNPWERQRARGNKDDDANSACN